MSQYRTAEVCLNGHVSTDAIEISPELREKFCSKCGEETTIKCKEWGAEIRGYHEVEGFIGIGSKYKPPSFCHNCGKPFEWTKRKINGAVELVKESQELSQNELNQFETDLNELTKDTPSVQVASVRFKKYMAKAGSAIATGVKDIIIGVISETAKKAIWGP